MPTKKPKIRFDILSIFPAMFDGYFGESILKRAQTAGLIDVKTHDLRPYSTDRHNKVDDRPFGGGAGMVMSVQPFYSALKALKALPKTPTKKSTKPPTSKTRVILLSAKGTPLTHQTAVRLAKYQRIVLLCGRYEGVDERVAQHLTDEEISIGSYVLTGGELPAMVVVDAVSRHIPGVLGDETSLSEESHTTEGQTEYPQYTRPADFEPKRGTKWSVPPELLSGDHKKIAEWRTKKQSRN